MAPNQSEPDETTTFEDKRSFDFPEDRAFLYNIVDYVCLLNWSLSPNVFFSRKYPLL